MATEVRYIDLNSDTPELLRLAEEVERTKVPLILRRDNKAIAELRPAKPSRKSLASFKRTGPDDPFWNIIGISDSEGPTDVSENIHKYVAEAYQPRPE